MERYRFPDTFANSLMIFLYAVLLIFYLLTLVRIFVNRKNVRLPVNLAFVAVSVLLWNIVTILRFAVADESSVYIFSLLPYAFALLSILAALFFILRFYDFGVFCKPHIIAACLTIPAITLLNIGLGFNRYFAGKPFDLILSYHDGAANLPEVAVEHLNYVYGYFGSWYYVQASIAETVALCLLAIAVLQHIRLPKIYRAPSEKMLTGLILILLGVLLNGFNTWGQGHDRLPFDLMLVGFVFSIRPLYKATLGNQGLVFLSQARNDIIQQLDQSILLLDEEKKIIFKNMKAAEWLGGLEFAGNSYTDLTDCLATVSSRREQLTDKEGGFDYHFEVGGQSRVYNLREKPIYDNRERQIGAYVIYSDETENRGLIQRLEVGAGRDALTGLHNRTMMESLRRELDKPDSLPLSVIICDLNDLKKTNDTHGHQAGDIMLRICGEALSLRCPPTAQAGRIGGDEFLVLLPQTGRLEAEDVVSSIRSYLSEIKDYPYQITMAMGCGVKDTRDQDINDALVTADEAMYANKRAIKGSSRDAAGTTLRI
ncbi:MAG: diguanylate cyclase [Oscillospiraceae bacterium]|jgi:diguanylate cyclase (GGDEF)-like protein|nr:diguanylate cyclase [Oscillospiraceae bacterium]